MRYLSVCSGIEAATVAWEPLGWEPRGFAEIDPFASAVLAHHWPKVRNYGDFTTIPGEPGEIDLLVGGTPCQSFSVAGLRGGLADDRGNLALQFFRLAARARPRWILWENVPGALSSNGGDDFAAILSAMGALGYGWAYRVLDAQFFGVPQRRRRVFALGYLGDWRASAQVLFEPPRVRGNPSARLKTGEGDPGAARNGAQSGGSTGGVEAAPPARFFNIAPSSGQGAVLEARETQVAMALSATAEAAKTERGTRVVSFAENQRGEVVLRDVSGALSSTGGGKPGQGYQAVVAPPARVRRFTPKECERLQGFPDDHTAIPWKGGTAPDALRYKAIGNSMAVPVMHWIGRRIDQVQRWMEE